MDDLNGHQDTLEEDIGLQRNIGGGFDVSEDRIAGSPTMKVNEDYSSAFNQISEHSGKYYRVQISKLFESVNYNQQYGGRRTFIIKILSIILVYF